MPIHSVPKEKDFILSPDDGCSSYKEHLNETFLNETFLNLDSVIKNLTEVYNSSFKTAFEILGLNESEPSFLEMM